MTTETSDIAKRIVTAAQRRTTDKRRQLELWRELRVDIQQQKHHARKRRSAKQYLPSILLFLFFISCPLSEQTVDWLSVGIFCLVNACFAVLASDPTAWMHLCIVTMCNFVLACWSHKLRTIPSIVAAVPARVYAVYTASNVCLVLLLYSLYVDRGLHYTRSMLRHWRHPPGTPSPRGSADDKAAAATVTAAHDTAAAAASGDDVTDATATGHGTASAMNGNGSSGKARRGNRRGHGSSGGSEGAGDKHAIPTLEVLERYVAEREFTHRLDMAACVCIIVNMVVLVYMKVIPYTLLLQSLRNVLSLVR